MLVHHFSSAFSLCFGCKNNIQQLWSSNHNMNFTSPSPPSQPKKRFQLYKTLLSISHQSYSSVHDLFSTSLCSTLTKDRTHTSMHKSLPGTHERILRLLVSRTRASTSCPALFQPLTKYPTFEKEESKRLKREQCVTWENITLTCSCRSLMY